MTNKWSTILYASCTSPMWKLIMLGDILLPRLLLYIISRYNLPKVVIVCLTMSCMEYMYYSSMISDLVLYNYTYIIIHIIIHTYNSVCHHNNNLFYWYFLMIWNCVSSSVLIRYLHYSFYNYLTFPTQLTQYCVIEDLNRYIHHYACSILNTCIHNFSENLKQKLSLKQWRKLRQCFSKSLKQALQDSTFYNHLNIYAIH